MWKVIGKFKFFLFILTHEIHETSLCNVYNSWSYSFLFLELRKFAPAARIANCALDLTRSRLTLKSQLKFSTFIKSQLQFESQLLEIINSFIYTSLNLMICYNFHWRQFAYIYRNTITNCLVKWNLKIVLWW